LLHLLAVLVHEVQLGELEIQVSAGDEDALHATELVDVLVGLRQPQLERRHVVVADLGHGRVALSVEGAEHELRLLAHHLPAFDRASADRPLGVAGRGLVLLDHGLLVVADSLQACGVLR
jgi:hypothetical protein